MNRLSRGLTLIEVMVTIAIIAVLAGIAYPNMSDFIDRQRLVGQTQAIADMAQTARSEVVKRRAVTDVNVGRLVVMTVNPGTNWSVGLVNRDPVNPAPCTSASECVLNKGLTTETKQWLQKSDAGSCPTCTMTEPTAQFVIVFDYRGLVATGGVQRAVTLRSPKGNKQLSVRISPLGRITLCSPLGTVTGYQACA